jgi:hypothetical protein
MNHEAPSEETLVQKTKAYRHPTGRKLNRAEKRIMSAAIKAADGANLDVETVIGWKPDAVPPRNPRKSPGRGPRRIGFNRLRDTSTSRDEEHPVARSTGRPLRTLYMSRATADEFDRRWLEMAAMGVRQRSGR